MKTKLPNAILFPEHAEQFLNELYANSDAFHPDDCNMDIFSCMEYGDRLKPYYRPWEATQLRILYKQMASMDFDPVAYLESIKL